MTFLQIWHQLCKKYPELKNDKQKVLFTAEHLKQLLWQIYYRGQASNQKNITWFDNFLKDVQKGEYND